MTAPVVTIIVPCRNEARFIKMCLASAAASHYPHDQLEILVVDGMSEDGTRAHIKGVAAREPRITMLDNPKLTAPAALNLGIKRARGDFIVRMDAHCEYPADYVPVLVAALERERADNVGGITEAIPGADTTVARAIALALAHPSGVGNSYFRIGTTAPQWVDTVPFGCWRREIFTRIGLFDESLPRNQDDEFNMRLARAGGRILLLPTVVTRYHARATLGQLWRMFWQYGVYKPLAARRARANLRPRQFAPAVFVTALALGLLLAPFGWAGAAVLKVTILAYVLFLLAAVIPVWLDHGRPMALAFAASLVTMHFAYGLGFLRGVLESTILKRGPAPKLPRLSR